MKIKRILYRNTKNFIYFWLDFLPLEALNRNKASILMYHSIGYNKMSFSVLPKDFEKQMNYLFQEKYNVVSLKKLVEYIKNKNIPEKTIVLTFDDGYEDNYQFAFSVLKRYKFPATIFLATSFIGKRAFWIKFPLPMLKIEQIKEMHNSLLIDFEPHTCFHLKLHKIPISKAVEEIQESKRFIENLLNKKCLFFAYPYGKFNSEIKEFLKKEEFLAAVTVKEGMVSLDDDPFLLKRNYIDSSVDFFEFKGKLNSAVEVFDKIFNKFIFNKLKNKLKKC